MKVKDIGSTICLCAALLAAVAGARPVIDGRIEADEWAGVRWHRGMRPLEIQKAVTKVVKDVDFGFLSDEKTLYFVARCHEEDMKTMRSLPKGIIWGDDNIELFLSPDGSSFNFYHFMVSGIGGHEATEFRSESGNIVPLPFHPKWERALGFEEKAWVVEMAIPLSSFSMTRNADWMTKWRFNLTRTTKFPRYAGYTYSPLLESFLESAKFLAEDGFPSRAPGDDLAAFGAVAQLTSRGGTGFLGTYSVDVFVPTAGPYELNGNRLDLPAGESKVTIPCAIAEEGRKLVHFTLRNVRTGNVHEHDYPVWHEFRPIRVKLTTPAYRNNFYPGQPTDRVAGTVEVLSGRDAVVTLEGPGFPTQAVTVKGGKGAFAFDTKGFRTGDAKLTATVADVEPVTLKIRNLPPTGHNMVWVEDGHLVANGKPIYRRNLYGPRYRTGHKLDELITAEWPTLGFSPETEVSVNLECGYLVKGIEDREGHKDVYPSAELLEKMAAKIDEARDRDFGYYYLSDEPECRGVSPVWLHHIYAFIAERDPYHPVFGASRGGSEHVDCFDVLETHPYISPHNDKDGVRRYTRPMRTIPQYVRRFGCENRPDKVIGHIPMLFAYRWQSYDFDYPTFREYVSAGWVAAIAGAKTVWPYCGHDWYDRAALWHGNRYLFESFAAYEQTLLLGTRTVVVETPEAIAGVWERADGDTLLAVVNLREDRSIDAHAALKDVPQLKGLALVEHRGERTFSLSAASHLELEPLETFVASVRRHDAGLASTAAVAARIDAEEKARLGRDNQLLERYLDVSISGDFGKTHYKLMDGMLWQQVARCASGKTRAVLEFTCANGFRPTFDRVLVHAFLDGTVAAPELEVWSEGGWKRQATRLVGSGKYLREIGLDRPVSADRFRIAFPGQKGQRNEVELYEIELPAVKGASDLK